MSAAIQIKNYRTKANLSQAEFARLVGVSQGQINHWETGRQRPGAGMALVIHQVTHGELTASELRPDLPWPTYDHSSHP